MITSTHDELASLLQEHKPAIAEKTYQARLIKNPNLEKTYSATDIKKFYQDCDYHLDFLSRAIAYDSPEIFTDYLLWARNLFAHIPINTKSVEDYFFTWKDVVCAAFEKDDSVWLSDYLDKALQMFAEPLQETGSFIDENSRHGLNAKHLLDLLLYGKKDEASKFILDMVDAGTTVRDCYLDIIQPVQYEVGRLWHHGLISVALEHYVTAASQTVMSQLYPIIMNHPNNGKRVVSACISGEQHEVGLRMVSDLMELDGWDTIFLGANTPIQSIPDITQHWKADLLAVSVTLSVHLDNLQQLIRLCHAQAPELKIMVGGYPFNLDKELWKKVGANGYAENAVAAIEMANNLTKNL